MDYIDYSPFFSFIGRLDEQKNTQDPKNNWEMGKGDVVKTLEGLTFKDLPIKNQLNLKKGSV